jgi:protein-tyrosine phosphatase
LNNIKNIRRIIFVDGHDINRAPMAVAIMMDELEKMHKTLPLEILSRGILVQFSEPLNQKAEAVMASNGIVINDFFSKKLDNGEITDKTLILAVDEKRKDYILDNYTSANSENTFVLAYYVGEELETLNPYGEPLHTYGLCFEALRETVRKLINLLEGE